MELPTGETETLFTNLGRKSFKKSEFMSLYFKRWPIETKYNTLKNKLEIENFSGRTLISVQQDFYATMYLSNLVAITKIMSDEEIKKQAKDKELKYKYQTNESRLISQLKDEMILCLLIEDPMKRSEVMERIIQAAARNKSPIRSERSFDRKDPEKR
ncbi:MAG: transposase, partial [Turicibacter sp.]|nr:transposase [Turicibacter sp.]